MAVRPAEKTDIYRIPRFTGREVMSPVSREL